MYWQGVVVFVLAVCSVQAKDQDIDDGVVTLKVLGKSGKIALCQKKNDQQKRKAKCVVMEFDQIMENDANGDRVDCQKHFLQNMASTDFVVSDAVDMEFQNISVKHFNFTTKMQSDKSQFTALMYIFKENGTYTYGDEEVNVLAGDVKVNLEIEDWVWCGDGSDGTEKPQGNKPNAKLGKYLDITVTVKGPNEKHKPKKKAPGAAKDKMKKIVKTKDGKERARKFRKQNKNAEELDMGNGTSLVLSKNYESFNGSQKMMKKMMTGYPKLEEQGSKTKTIYRFEKGSKVSYDPNMQVVDIDPEAASLDDEDDDSGVSTVAASICLILTCLIIGY